MGAAPGITLDELIFNVRDPSAQAIFQLLLSNQNLMQQSLQANAQYHQVLESMLSSIQDSVLATQRDVQDTKNDVTQLKASAVFACPLPALIHAETRSNSECDLVDTQGSSASPLTVECDGPLHCPFCPKKHDSERSHHQHMRRIALRFCL